MRTRHKVTYREFCSVWASTLLCIQDSAQYRPETNYSDGGIS